MRRTSAPCAYFLARQIWITAANEHICFLVWPLQDTAMGILCEGEALEAGGGGILIKGLPGARGGGYSYHAWLKHFRTIDPRISTMRDTALRIFTFSPTRQTLLAPSAKRRDVFGESHGG